MVQRPEEVSIFDAGLYTNSTVAVDVETGALRWYFQHVPSQAGRTSSRPTERVPY